MEVRHRSMTSRILLLFQLDAKKIGGKASAAVIRMRRPVVHLESEPDPVATLTVAP